VDDERTPPDFDLDAALVYSGGEMAVFRTVAEMFLSSLEERLGAIASAVAAHDDGALERSAHSLKGAAATLAGACLADRAGALERIGRDGDWEVAEPALESLHAAAARLSDVLRSHLEGGPAG